MPLPSVVAVHRRVEPILAREMAGLDQVERYTWGPLQEDPHPSTILRTRSTPGSALGQLYRDMREKDLALGGLLRKRERAVLSLPRLIEPRDGSPAALEAARLVQEALSAIPQFDQALREVLRAITDGISFAELLWAPLPSGEFAGALVPVEMRDRPMSRFLFRQRQLFIRQRGAKATEAPPMKFLVARYGSSDSPWGRGLLDECYWYHFIAKHGMKYWSVFVERWAQGTPWVSFKAGRGTGDDLLRTNKALQDQAMQIVNAILTEGGFVAPEGFTPHVLESTRSGSISYEAFLAYIRQLYALLILGEVDTSGAGSGPGSFAKSQISNEVRLETVREDAHFLGSLLSDTLVRWIVELNLGPEAPLPKLRIDTLESEDRAQRQEGTAAVLALGLPVPRADLYRLHQVREPRPDEEVVTKSQPAPSAVGADPAPSQEVSDSPEDGEEPSAESSQQSDPAHQRLLLSDEDRAAADAYDEQQQAVIDLFTAESATYWAGVRAALDAAFEAGTDGLLGRVANDLSPLALVHARRLQAALIHAAGMEAERLEAELGDLRLAARPGLDQALTPDSAVQFWLRILRTSSTFFEGLVDQLRRLAFRIAGVEEADTYNAAHELLGQAIREGWGRGRWKSELAELFRRLGRDPLAPWHSELVLANNVRQTGGSLRWQQTVGNPAVHPLIPYLRVITFGDDKVRARENHNHRVVDGATFAIGHEFWRTWWIPFGHGCRCQIQSISRLRAQREGLTGAEPSGPWPIDPLTSERALPDPGFRGIRTFEGEERAAEERLGRQLDRARAAGGRDLLSALAEILRSLGLDPNQTSGPEVNP